MMSFTMVLIAQNTQTTKIQVSGACGSCEHRIEEVANKFDHVVSADWHLHDQILTVEHTTAFKVIDLEHALAKAGHDTEHVKATQENYYELPACCQYRTVSCPF